MKQHDALELMKAGLSVFITGAPGAGKTYVLNQFITWACKHGKNVAVTASTGIAATHLDGMTVHAWAGIGVSQVLTPRKLSEIRGRRTQAIRSTDVLVIDEISMLKASVVDMVDEVCRKIRGDARAFGGLQVILAGDLFQLPPVTRKGLEAPDPRVEEVEKEYIAHGKNPDGFMTDSFAWETAKFRTCYITEQHRQDDGELLDILTDIRNDQVSAADRRELQSRMGKRPSASETVIHLYPHNVQVDKINQDRLNDLFHESHFFTAFTRGDVNSLVKLEKNVLAPHQLELKYDAHVMALWNDPEGRYFNGSLGRVVDFLPEEDMGFPVVKFDNGNTVAMQPRDWKLEDNGTEMAFMQQVPLRLAWAITIHKSQGMTLDAEEADLSRSFTNGMGYVALSRLTSLAGLYLEGINDTAYRVSPEALKINSALIRDSEQLEQDLHHQGVLAVAKLHQPSFDEFSPFALEGGSKASGHGNNAAGRNDSAHANSKVKKAASSAAVTSLPLGAAGTSQPLNYAVTSAPLNSAAPAQQAQFGATQTATQTSDDELKPAPKTQSTSMPDLDEDDSWWNTPFFSNFHDDDMWF